MKSKSAGFSLIELMIVLAILSLLLLLAIFAYRTQMTKGRDAKRKADLDKLQKAMEDYLNDNNCYPDEYEEISGWLLELPQDPINAGSYIYYYSVAQEDVCKGWYKIFATLENKSDADIKKVGCGEEKCEPYNYVVTSANVIGAEPQPGEIWPPVGGVPPVAEPTPTSVPPTATLTPTPTSAIVPTPTPTPAECLSGWYSCVNQNGKCNSISPPGPAPDYPGVVCSPDCNGCTAQDCSPYPACLYL